MKKIILSILFLSSFLSLKCNDNISEGTIPFIFDRHLYLKITLNDTISATIIYDTGADFLYLDEDYLKLNNLQDAFGKKGFAKMGGAGNSDPQRVTIFIDPVKINFGNINYRNKITPVIKLRDILGRHTDGLLGNTHILSSALEINFSNRYIKQLKEPLSEKFLDKYTKLEARFEKNRIDVKAKLEIDSTNTVEGWFRVDLGSGGSVSLTNEITSSLNLDRTPKAYFETQAGGIGGGSEEILLRAKKLCMADTIENIVIKCSLNKKGALSSDKPYLGLIGNKIWSLYDIILDPTNSSVYVKRNNESGIYSQSSTTQMEVFDRLWDSGNSLREPGNGRPVLVLAPGTLESVLPRSVRHLMTAEALRNPAELLEPLMTAAPELRPRLLPYHAVGTDAGLLLTIRTDWVEVEGIRHPGTPAALAPSTLGTGYAALWGGEIRKEGRHEQDPAVAFEAVGVDPARSLYRRQRHPAAASDPGTGERAAGPT